MPKLETLETKPGSRRKRKNNVIAGKATNSKDLKRVSREWDKVWYCCEYSVKWYRNDPDEWIVCDKEECSRVYHIRCTSVTLEGQYRCSLV